MVVVVSGKIPSFEKRLMKTHVKKKARQEFERAQAHKGLVNEPNGNWTNASETGIAKNMVRDYKAGYRVGRRK